MLASVRLEQAKPETQNSVWVSHMGSRDPSTWAVTCFSGCSLAGNCIWSRVAGLKPSPPVWDTGTPGYRIHLDTMWDTGDTGCSVDTGIHTMKFGVLFFVKHSVFCHIYKLFLRRRSVHGFWACPPVLGVVLRAGGASGDRVFWKMMAQMEPSWIGLLLVWSDEFLWQGTVIKGCCPACVAIFVCSYFPFHHVMKHLGTLPQFLYWTGPSSHQNYEANKMYKLSNLKIFFITWWARLLIQAIIQATTNTVQIYSL